jgi:hypothetical protein
MDPDPDPGGQLITDPNPDPTLRIRIRGSVIQNYGSGSRRPVNYESNKYALEHCWQRLGDLRRTLANANGLFFWVCSSNALVEYC